MLKPIATLAAAGVVGVILTQLLWLVLAPILGLLIGSLVWIVKIALIVGLAWLAWVLFRKLTERGSEA
jgi:hypothetical protein